MAVEQYSLMAGDWLGLGYIINDLATRVIGQVVAPGSSPTFAGTTIDLLTMDAAISTAIDIGGLYTGSQITLTGTSATDHAIEIDGVYGAALIYTHTSSATADTLLWGDMASTAITGDFNGLRPRLTCNAASGGLNARAVYGEVIVGASKYAALTQGLFAHVSYAAGGCHITDIHALGVHISQGASLIATNLYGIIVTIQTRGDETISGNDYMMRLDNEAVGGNGRQMDAAIQIVNTNMGGGVKGYGYGIDFSGATFATAEIRFSNGETIDNLTDGQLDITGDLAVSGTVTAEQLTSTDDITAGDSFFGSIGTAGSPTYSFTAAPDSGMYSDGIATLLFATVGTRRLYINNIKAVFTVPIEIVQSPVGTLNLTYNSITSSTGAISFGTDAIAAGAITGTSFIIGGNTLDTTEWAYLDGQDQALKTTDSPAFAAISLGTAPPTGYNLNLDGWAQFIHAGTTRAVTFTPGSLIVEWGTTADKDAYATYGAYGNVWNFQANARPLRFRFQDSALGASNPNDQIALEFDDVTGKGVLQYGLRIGDLTAPTAALSMANDSLIAVDVDAGLTASTTQSQGQGALTAQVNEVSTVANDDDTVTLPAAVTGIEIEIINNGAKTLQIFPASGDDLGLGTDTAEELEANERVKFVAYDNNNWAKESTTEIIHAEIHDEDNTDAFVINDAGGDFHSYHTNGLVAGDLVDWTFDAGGAGTSHAITSIADGVDSGNDIEVTTGDAHGLAVGDIVSQTNLVDAAYVGVFDVKAIISATQYEVAATFAATGTGTMDQAATLEANAVAAGSYSFAYYISAKPVGNQETFDFQLYKEATAITGSKIRRKFGAGADFGSMSGGGVVDIADGEKISLAISNEDSAANLTIRNLTIVLIRL